VYVNFGGGNPDTVFLAADDGDRDHFIHASVLNRAGFANLVPGGSESPEQPRRSDLDRTLVAKLGEQFYTDATGQ